MLDVGRGPAAIRAAVLAFKAADRTLRTDINRATRDTMNPVWRGLIESRARSPLDAKLLGKGARIKAGNPPTGQAATSRRALRGGLNPVEDWHGWEFGGDQNKTTTYTRRSPRGTSHTVTRHASRQVPSRIRTGRVVYPAVAQIGPRLASLWASIIVRKYFEAAEKAS